MFTRQISCKPFSSLTEYEFLLMKMNQHRSCSLLQSVPAALYTDPNEIAQHLTLKLTVCEKLELPVTEPQTTADQDPQ